MTAAKKEEMSNVFRSGTCKIMLKEEVPADGNVLSGRFVLSINSSEDGIIKYKARYVIGEHRDKFKDMMVYSNSALEPSICSDAGCARSIIQL